jgi:membrane protein
MPGSTLQRTAVLAALGVAAATSVAAVQAERHLHPDARTLRDGPGAGNELRRGRAAPHPGAMTLLGWKDILVRTWNEAFDDGLFSVAAAVAFFTLLSLVPAMSVIISIYGIFSDPDDVITQLGPFLALLPEAGRGLIVEQAERLASQPAPELSLALGLSLVLAIWSANAAMKAMFDALNAIYDEREKRSFLRYNLVSLGTTITAIALLLAAIFLLAVGPSLIEWLYLTPMMKTALWLLRWPVAFAVAVCAIALLYWVGPSRKAVRFVWLLPGAAAAALIWVAASTGFAWYAATLGDYAATYGSLAAVVVLMTWLWLSASIILLGGELNAELEHQTARDTTTGAPKPLGLRGATMADSVGPAVASR